MEEIHTGLHTHVYTHRYTQVYTQVHTDTHSPSSPLGSAETDPHECPAALVGQLLKQRHPQGRGLGLSRVVT